MLHLWLRRLMGVGLSAGLFILIVAGSLTAAEPFHPVIPQTWDYAALRDLELPLAGSGKSPGHITPEYYYAQKVRPIYASYPVYHPDREPPGYIEHLKAREPVVMWNDRKPTPQLETEADWIAAGEMVFDAPIDYVELTPEQRAKRNADFRTLAYPLTKEGVIPFHRYVVREKGKVELGILSCAECHTRVMPDGQIIKGAQGNPPFDRQFAREIRDNGDELARILQRVLFGGPWVDQAFFPRLDATAAPEIAPYHERIPPGVLARHGSAGFSPVQIPDLMGVADRRYLDHTGLQRNRDLGDLMRYAALNQGGDLLSDFSGFIPGAEPGKGRPDPATLTRYGEDQLYALALYIKNLKPPPNPNPFNELARRGQAIFEEQDCARCHDPAQGYSNHKLALAPGFVVPPDHPARADIMLNREVGTDPTLATKTRRGTGLYKVPSLRGVWYRGFFEHNGSCATLEDWFDPRRLEETYVPTGWKGPPGTKTRAVKGHDFGLDLNEADRKALLAFLRTL
jgi:hypothetical protein